MLRILEGGGGECVWWWWGVGWCGLRVGVHEDLDFGAAVLREVADVALYFWDFVPGVGTLVGDYWLGICEGACGG